jgi:hypothetical protein
MTIEASNLSTHPAEIARKSWTAPAIHVLDLHAAQGATAGPLCDKHGSLSGTLGNDRCNTATK